MPIEQRRYRYDKLLIWKNVYPGCDYCLRLPDSMIRGLISSPSNPSKTKALLVDGTSIDHIDATEDRRLFMGEELIEIRSVDDLHQYIETGIHRYLYQRFIDHLVVMLPFLVEDTPTLRENVSESVRNFLLTQGGITVQPGEVRVSTNLGNDILHVSIAFSTTQTLVRALKDCGFKGFNLRFGRREYGLWRHIE